MTILEMVPKHTLSFKEFVRLSEHQRKSLGRVTILPPQLGEPGFGCVVVEKPVFFKRASGAGSLLKRRAGR